jgi:peptidoglycan/xylan/chitin deacetylase (PgdA/CDA1 family)
VNAEKVPAMLQQLARDAAVTLPEQAPEDFAPMDWDMARALERRGVRFAPHSVTHRILSRVSDNTSAIEILDAWKTLDTELENPLKLFCYPTGRAMDYSQREVRILRDNGFMGAVTTIPGFADFENNEVNQLYNLPRFALPDTMEDFIQCCSWIEYAKERFRKPNPRTSG